MRLLMNVSKNRHGTYYAIKKVPKRLEHAVAQVLGGAKPRQSWLKRSLGTKDLQEANERAKPVLIEFDTTLRRAEALLSERPLRTSLSPIEIKRMTEYLYASRLAAQDGFLRIAPEVEQEFRDEFPGETWADPVPDFGLSGGQVADLKENIPPFLREAEAALGQGNIAFAEVHIEEVLDAFQINLDKKSPAYQQLGLAVLRTLVNWLRVSIQRVAGEPIETPPLPAIGTTAAVAGDTLTAALEGWKRQNTPSRGTLAEYERAVRQFVELHGDLPVAHLRKSHARQFREALQDVPRNRPGKLRKASLPELATWGREHPGAPKNTANTVNKTLGGVQAVTNWARDNGMVPDDVQWSDPFTRMRLKEGEAVRGGAPFDLADLKVIFRTPVFTEGQRPAGGQGEAAFWLPLLALFTGARLQELTALRASDVVHNEIIGAIAISIQQDAKVGKKLKTEQSERFVPVHPQLIEIGFLDYAAAQAKAHGEKAWLFPKVSPETTGRAGFSKWFGRYIGSHGITDPTKVFHSFRHAFLDALRLAGVSTEINIALLGHTDTSVHGNYGAKEKAMRFRHRLAEAVASVRYKGLDLSHLTTIERRRAEAGA